MTEAALVYGFYGALAAVSVAVYVWRQKRRDRSARETVAQSVESSSQALSQHPQIDVTHCIGCQGCTSVCPEGSVLGMIGGKAAVVKGSRCIGHGMCAEACPVGAITLVRAAPGVSADLPYLSPELETSVPGLYIAGELGGLALIKNAVNQGRDCMDTIAARLAAEPDAARQPDVFDVVIVGAGPAGISASLRAIEHKLRYLTLEREAVGGSVAKYPRQKLVMTSPVTFPLVGAFRKSTLSKEDLLAFWKSVGERHDFRVEIGQAVEKIRRDADGVFTVQTPGAAYRGRAVLLAMGRAGTPRKLGVPGEELPKVMYRLIEADHYVNKHILVVGGGDSAVEAALGLAIQKGNRVTLSYRKDSFSRIKERNAVKVREFQKSGKLEVLFNSNPVEIRESSVLIEVDGETREMANDYVWVFAGGVAPNEFLKSIGVHFGPRDLTAETVERRHPGSASDGPERRLAAATA